MPANIYISTRGNTLTVRLSGPLDGRIASSLFNRFLLAKSRYDELVGKRLAAVGCYEEGCIAHSPAPNDDEHTPVPAATGHPRRGSSPFFGAPGQRHACAPAALSDAA